MSTLIERCNQLAKIFIKTNNKKYAAKVIIREIDCLLYSNTKQPVDFNLKRIMVQVTGELITGKRPLLYTGDNALQLKKKDALKFIKLENYILQELWYRHELKEREVADSDVSIISVKTFKFDFRSPKNSQFDLGAL